MDSSEIEALEGLEAVRRRPEMYIGPLSAAEMPSRLVVQALCHAFGEALEGNCKHVALSYGERALVSVVYDAGDLTPHPKFESSPAKIHLELQPWRARQSHYAHPDLGS